jgi:hypothetical protein
MSPSPLVSLTEPGILVVELPAHLNAERVSSEMRHLRETLETYVLAHQSYGAVMPVLIATQGPMTGIRHADTTDYETIRQWLEEHETK